MNIKKICVLILTLMASPNIADASSVKLPPREAYSGARAHGMGNAFVAVADDESAIFANPAGIGQEDGKGSKNLLRGASFPNLTVAGNQSPSAVNRAYLRTEGSGTARLTNAINKLAEYDAMYGRVSFFPYLTLGRLQLGLLMDEEMLSVKTHSETALESSYNESLTYQDKLNIYSRSQMGGVVGLSIPHKSLGLTLGVAGRFVSRTTLLGEYEIGEEVTPISAAALSKSINKTTGIALDLGLLYTPQKIDWSPTVGVALRDAGDTLYKAKTSSNVSEIEVMNVAAGASIRPTFGKYASMLFATEAEYLNDDRVKWDDRVKGGVELTIGESDSTAPVSLRVGWSARNLSYGATADLLLFKVDVGRYSSLIQTEDGLKPDARTILRLSIDLRS